MLILSQGKPVLGLKLSAPPSHALGSSQMTTVVQKFMAALSIGPNIGISQAWAVMIESLRRIKHFLPRALQGRFQIAF